MTDVIEYVRRSTLNIIKLSTAHIKVDLHYHRYHIVENNFATTVTTKWKLGLTIVLLPKTLSEIMAY